MNEELERVQRVLACLGDRSRFRVVTALVTGEYCVSDLARQVGLSQSCTTRHLQTLQREGLVHRLRQGKKVIFRLRDDEPEISGLLEWALIRAPLPQGAGYGHPAGAVGRLGSAGVQGGTEEGVPAAHSSGVRGGGREATAAAYRGPREHDPDRDPGKAPPGSDEDLQDELEDFLL